MGNFVKLLIISIIVCVLAIFSVACVDIEVKSGENAYDPSFVLSGNLEKTIKYSPSSSGLKLEKLELKNVLESVKAKGEIEKLLVMTHGAKCVLINSPCVPYYFFSVSSNGVVRMSSTIEMHNTIGMYPLVSIAEILVLTNEKSGINLVYEDKSEVVDYLTFLKARGMLVKVRDATADNLYEITTFNFRTVNVKKLLGNHEIAVLKFKDGSFLKIDGDSSYIVNFSNGYLHLASENGNKLNTEKFAQPIIEIDYRIMA